MFLYNGFRLSVQRAMARALTSSFRCSIIIPSYPKETMVGQALLHIFLVFSVSFRRVTLQQYGDYHVAIKAQDIRTSSQRSL
jgi:hypothetical protein